MTRPLRVFLCHASQDKPAVWKLYRFLKQRGVQPWLDQADLLPGQHWEVEIPKAIFASDVILVCLSKNSVNKEGYVQKEIVFALDKALEKPEGTIFIVPVKLEECDVPKRLSPYQWVDYYRSEGRKRLLMGLNMRATDLGPDVEPVIFDETRRRKPTPTPRLQEQIDREAVEKTAVEKADREIISNALREKKEQDAIAKAVHDAKEIAEKVEGVGMENWEREAREKEKRRAQKRESPDRKPMPKKPFTKILDPNALAPKVIRDSQGEKKPTADINVRWLSIGGIIFIGLTLSLLGGNYILNNLSATITPTLTSSESLMSPTLTATKTYTPSPLTFTATSQPIKTPEPIPTLGIGSTIVSEKDGMTLVYVPAGEFTMGDNAYYDTQPIHQVDLDAYWIDQTEVTNAMYAECINVNQCDLPAKTSSNTRSSYFGNSEFDNYPVLYVSWNDAEDYCAYAGRTLPSEAEWEKAARGTDGNIYPWGNESANAYLLNYYDSNIRDTTAVGSYPDGASIYGALDMAGNVWEWVSSSYQPYPYDANDGRENLTSSKSRVLRGGSWTDFISLDYDLVRSTKRDRRNPTFMDSISGFRCARSQ